MAKSLIKAAFLCIAFITVIGIIGKDEYNDQVIYHMSDHTYNKIVEKLTLDLGHEPTNSQIVAEFEKGE